MRVVVNGYEQGCDDLPPEQITVIPMALTLVFTNGRGDHGERTRTIIARSLKRLCIEVLALRRISK